MNFGSYFQIFGRPRNFALVSIDLANFGCLVPNNYRVTDQPFLAISLALNSVTNITNAFTNTINITDTATNLRDCNNITRSWYQGVQRLLAPAQPTLLSHYLTSVAPRKIV